MVLFRPDKLDYPGILINYKCTIACRHCLYACSPNIKEDIDVEKLKTIVKEIKKADPKCEVHIGGGEPLFEYGILKEVAGEVLKQDLKLAFIETNGTTIILPGAKEKLKELKSIGVTRMFLSVSPFHNEFISIKENKQACNTIKEVFGDKGIFISSRKFYPLLERAGQEKPVSILDYKRLFTEEEFKQQFSHTKQFSPKGRGAFFAAEMLNMKFPAKIFLSANRSCKLQLSAAWEPHLDYMGNYMAGCCSGITLGQGSAFELEKLYNEGINLKDYPVLEILINKNMAELYKFAELKGFKININEKRYGSRCHLCQHIRTFLYTKYPGEFKELCLDFLYKEMANNFRC